MKNWSFNHHEIGKYCIWRRIVWNYKIFFKSEEKFFTRQKNRKFSFNTRKGSHTQYLVQFIPPELKKFKTSYYLVSSPPIDSSAIKLKDTDRSSNNDNYLSGQNIIGQKWRNVRWWRKFCPTNNFVRRKFWPTKYFVRRIIE